MGKYYDTRAPFIKERLDKWRALTPAEQVARLDERLGVGVGAKKQRALLAKKLESKA